MSLNCDRVWHRRRSSMTTCSFLCRVARRKGMQSCYFLVCIGWMWYGITISWAWQTNCIGSIEGFSRSNRYFYQTIAVRRNLNQTSWNDWTFRRPHVCHKYLFAQMSGTRANCPPTRDALLQHVRREMSESDIWARWMMLGEVDQNLADLDWLVDEKKRAAGSMGNIIKSITSMQRTETLVM